MPRRWSTARKPRRPISTRAPTTGGNDFDASSRTIYSRLVEFKHGSTDDRARPRRQAGTISDDGLDYTFHLHPGVKFQTTDYFTPTRDLNADDVVFSFERQFNKENPWYGDSTCRT